MARLFVSRVGRSLRTETPDAADCGVESTRHLSGSAEAGADGSRAGSLCDQWALRGGDAGREEAGDAAELAAESCRRAAALLATAYRAAAAPGASLRHPERKVSTPAHAKHAGCCAGSGFGGDAHRGTGCGRGTQGRSACKTPGTPGGSARRDWRRDWKRLRFTTPLTCELNCTPYTLYINCTRSTGTPLANRVLLMHLLPSGRATPTQLGRRGVRPVAQPEKRRDAACLKAAAS